MARVTILGDSHMQGMADPLIRALQSDGHAVVLSMACPGKELPFYLSPISRDAINTGTDYGKCSVRDSAGVLTLLPRTGDELVAASRPDILLLQLGGNNFDLDPASYAGKIECFVGAARNAGVRQVVWLGPLTATSSPEKATKNAMTGKMQMETLQRLGVPWIDLRPYSLTGHRDGVHLSREGYTLLVERMMPELRAAMTGESRPLVPLIPAPTQTQTLLMPAAPPPAPDPTSPWVYAAAISAAFLVGAVLVRRSAISARMSRTEPA